MHTHIKHTCPKSNKGFVYLRYLMAIKAFHLTGLAKEFRGSSFIKSWNTQKKRSNISERLGSLGAVGQRIQETCFMAMLNVTHFYMEYSESPFFLLVHTPA